MYGYCDKRPQVIITNTEVKVTAKNLDDKVT